jgi:fructose-1,6-bisphosphatase
MQMKKMFDDYLRENGVEEPLIEVFRDLMKAFRVISNSISVTDVRQVGSKNVFGEEQLALDVLADNVLEQAMMDNEFVGKVASEERKGEVMVGGDGPYCVCYDPLDGSSLVDVNLSIGSIVGIYKRKGFVGATGDDQVASAVAIYGPSTIVLLTVKKGVAKFVMDDRGRFVFSDDGFKVGEGKMFSPGNLRACKFRQDYFNLLNYWVTEQYTLRYSGGMVPDVMQIILKGKGIFSYPGYEDSPDGKLRLLFECAPLALLMEQAGGAATDGKMRILDKEILAPEQISQIFIGSKGEVKRCEEYLF